MDINLVSQWKMINSCYQQMTTGELLTNSGHKWCWRVWKCRCWQIKCFDSSYLPSTRHRPEFPDRRSHPRRFSWRRALRDERPQPELPHQSHVRTDVCEYQKRRFEQRRESAAWCVMLPLFCPQVHHQNRRQAWDPQRDHWEPKGMRKLLNDTKLPSISVV